MDFIRTIKSSRRENTNAQGRRLGKAGKTVPRKWHKQFWKLAQFSPFPISIIDKMGNYLFINRKFTELFGYELGDIPTGRAWFNQAFSDPADRRTAIADWQSDLQSCGPNEARARQFTITCKDATARTVLFRPVSLENGYQFTTYEDLTEIHRARDVLQRSRLELENKIRERTAALTRINEQLRSEIKERKRTEQALAESEHLCRAVFETARDSIFVKDASLRYTHANPAMERLFGLPLAQLTGKTDIDLFGPEAGAHIRGVDGRVLKGEVVEEEHTKPVDGEPVTFHVIKVPMRGAAGRITGLCGIARDITGRKRAESARRKAEAELERHRLFAIRADRLQALGEMAAGMAHELNQPLSGVRGLAEHLLIAMDRGWPLPLDKIREKLRLIMDQADRMTHLIDHVRLFARKAGKPEMRAVDVNDIIRSCAGIVTHQFKAHGLELGFHLAEPLPPVTANPFSLEEVCLNLMINARHASEGCAADASPGGNPVIRICTGTDRRQEKTHVVIRVIDQGTGIPGEILGDVFNPFFTTKGPDKGTGLGLSISKSIVEDFGGTIGIESEPGTGTTVTVSLPADE